MKLSNLAAAILVTTSLSTIPVVNAAKPLTLPDIMQFESLAKPIIADNGETLAVEAKPDRGDSRVIVKDLATGKSFNLAGAKKPKVSADGRYVAMVKAVPLLEKEKASEKEKKKLKSGLILLDTQTGKQEVFERVKSFSFNETASHLAIHFEKPEQAKKSKDGGKPKKDESSIKVDKFDKGHPLRLITLADDSVTNFDNVTSFYFDKLGHGVAIAVNDSATKQHQVIRVDFKANQQTQIFTSTDLQIGNLALTDDGNWLAFTTGQADEKPYGREYKLNLVDLNSKNGSFSLTSIPNTKEWTLNRYSKLSFSDDNNRLFFGRVPEVNQQLTIAKVTEQKDLLDADVITGQRNLRVWNGEDPLIKPNEVKHYKDELKRTYLAVLDVANQSVTQLADSNVLDVERREQSMRFLGSSDLKYRKMITWAGFYRDVFLVDSRTGTQTQVLTQYPSYWAPSLSPKGNYIAYYQHGNIYLYNVETGTRKNVSKGIETGFANEDHDYPSNAPGYGFGPWLTDENAVLVNDKFDVWKLDTHSGKMTNLTRGKGRKQGIQFRVTGLVKDGDPATLTVGQKVLLKGYNERSKSDDFYQLNLAGGFKQLTSEPVKMKVLARSKKADTLVYSKERYDQFPDLYTSSYLAPQKATQQTDLNQQIKPYQWGNAELVHWTNGDGKPLDGVLIKPASYKQGQRLPVLVYFYRFMSDRLHSFPQMKINHRPNFAWFVENGYAIFLPDIRFEVGYPGLSSVQALTSGVQHLIDLGVADPDAIGIQGHSWAGYQSAFAATQTNIFKAIITGAPVSNMTSAYSGIRHGSGLARQFQYETGQSRIGPSLYEAPQKYIENSPIFYVDRIKTPMMIMFGDKDDAVPWEQGVELYLAMRRAGKDVVFLQYQDEPHHLKKYPNKLDYTIKMKQYFDHYLKGEPAPEWLTKGEAYYEYQK
ncbi:prolyl oligopeptidase family serine peptidase [Parashewanella spongiae]|nr:prolyl oligopeptidase family serine peptidase [Parashewanella spongiae]MCL1077908.1 prolyl oligopeptidase family serine peptidase [Parashewanella spongiae]